MRLTTDLRKLARVSWADRWLLIQAFAWLTFLRVALLILPFRRIASFLHLSADGEHAMQAPLSTAAAERVGWAVRAAAKRTPWKSACLVQALTAAALLHRRNLPATLYVGVAKAPGPAGGMTAHAWLACGDRILTGAHDHERYRVISVLT